MLELRNSLSRDHWRQIALVLVVLFSYGLALARAGSSLFPTLFVVTIVALGGLGLTHAMANRFRDRNVGRLGEVFLVKLLLLLALVYVGWTPELDPAAPGF